MIDQPATLASLLLIVFLGAMFFFIARVNSGRRPSLRQIQAFEFLRGLAGRAIEAGRTFHLSLGIGSTADVTTADSMAGLYVLDYLADQSRLTGIHPLVSMANPTVMLFAQNVLRAAQGDNSPGARAAYRSVHWIAPQPAAYAAGVMSLLSLSDVEANVMVGDFGDEYLLMGETAARHDISHVGGTSDPNVLPFVYASAQETLFGEEIYAAGAYLQERPSHIGSLLAQDAIRWLVALIILGGVIVASLGYDL